MSDKAQTDTETEDIEPVVIRNEKDALELLRAALADELEDQPLAIRFEGWPVVTLKFEGEGYESTITPDIAEALLLLQAAMNRAYARVAHHSTNARSLTDAERRELQLMARVDKGSSLINVDLGKWADALASVVKDKMTGKSIAATVIGVALVGGGTLVAKDFIQAQADAVKVEQETKAKLALSAEETERLKIVTEAMKEVAELKHAAQDFDDARRKALKAGAAASKVTIQGVELTGQEARQISTSPRATSEDVQLNGHYVIQKVDWQQVDEAKVTLASQDGFGTFVAKFRIMTLAEEQKAKLQAAEWGRKPLYMQINGTRLRGEITTATIISAEWPKPNDVQADGAAAAQ